MHIGHVCISNLSDCVLWQGTQHDVQCPRQQQLWVWCDRPIFAGWCSYAVWVGWGFSVAAAATQPVCDEMTWRQACSGGWVCECGMKLRLRLEWGLV